MRIFSWNVNGIRACSNKGFLDFLKEEQPDIIGIQEIKARITDLPEGLAQPSGYHSAWHSAEKSGYSGVALFTREKPLTLLEGFGFPEFDCEGRVIVAEYPDFFLLNIYFPNGQMSPERLQYKLSFYDALFAYTNDLKKIKGVIIMGDYNTAHKEIDLANPKQNENYSGFLPVEREWMDRIISYGYTDTFRMFNQEPAQYTWWTYRFGARKRNIGWRIDYVMVSNDIAPRVKNAYILSDITGSDHCPIGIDWE